MCQTSWWKSIDCFVVYKCLWFRAIIIDQRCTSYKCGENNSYEERYTYCLSKKAIKYMSTSYFFILYSIWVRVESPKYKMSCLISPKSSEFDKKKKPTLVKNPSLCWFYHFLTTSQLIFKNREIKKIKGYASGGIRTRNSWDLRLRNTCVIGCAKKTAENEFNDEDTFF